MLSLLRQVIQLLSESPGTIVYHLVTIFALQAVFAISFSQWRRNRHSTYAFRVMMGAAGILVTRLLLLIVGILVVGNPQQATAVLPLLDQAINSATILLMVWALTPHSERLPQLGDLLLLMGLLIIGAMYASFSQSWQAQAAIGTAYNSTIQATIWGVLQMAVLAGGILLVLFNARWRRTLSPIILLLLFLTHVAHFWNYPEIIPTETNVSYWIRLGHLFAIPLWAVMAYRQSLLPLIKIQRSLRSPLEIVGRSFTQATQVLAAATVETAVMHAILLINEMVQAPFVGIGLFSEDRQQLMLHSNQPQIGENNPRFWQLNLNDWSAFQVATNQRRQIDLRADGAGAGQLHRLTELLGVVPFGSLIIEPLQGKLGTEGLLLLAQPESTHVPHPDDMEMTPILAAFVAQRLENLALSEQTAAAEPVTVNMPDAEVDGAVSGRMIALEEEQLRLKEQITIAHNRLQQAEGRAVAAGKRAHDLAAAMTEMERMNQDERVMMLEQEIDSLRESLLQAEEAMALASAGEGGLSTEWVMLTITRYSGQLEEAQARIVGLEQALARHESDTADPVLISLIQELRTPMTSIAGFTQLVLGETMGILGVKQRDALQRIKANSERMGTLLEQIVQLTTPQKQVEVINDELVDVREVIETAVNGIITQVREKRLHLDLEISEALPMLPIARQDLHQIVTNLLSNACQVSQNDSRIAVTAQENVIPSQPQSDQLVRFVQIAISDSGGGVPDADWARVFAPQHSAEMPLITGVGDTGAGLSLAQKLAVANGGRIWLESKVGGGSTFSLLFPINTHESETDGARNGNLLENH